MLQHAVFMYEQGMLPDPTAQQMEQGENWVKVQRFSNAIDQDKEIQQSRGFIRGYTPTRPLIGPPTFDLSPSFLRQPDTTPCYREMGLPPTRPSPDQNSCLVAQTFAAYSETHDIDPQPRRMHERPTGPMPHWETWASQLQTLNVTVASQPPAQSTQLDPAPHKPLEQGCHHQEGSAQLFTMDNVRQAWILVDWGVQPQNTPLNDLDPASRGRHQGPPLTQGRDDPPDCPRRGQP